jgi:uncharacterized protein (DUF1684 family)
MTPEEQLADYRQRVAMLYAHVRQANLDAEARCATFRQSRNELFRTHPQSALSAAQQELFTALCYYPYDPALRFILPVEPDAELPTREIQLQDDGLLRMRRFGRVRFTLSGQNVALSLYWIMGYGGGIFLPFGDATNGHETYGGGRYLLDTIKHADLGHEATGIVVDFNYAYNPSCAYNPRWVCPLTPPENRLPIAVRAGEMTYP